MCIPWRDGISLRAETFNARTSFRKLNGEEKFHCVVFVWKYAVEQLIRKYLKIRVKSTKCVWSDIKFCQKTLLNVLSHTRVIIESTFRSDFSYVYARTRNTQKITKHYIENTDEMGSNEYHEDTFQHVNSWNWVKGGREGIPHEQKLVVQIETLFLNATAKADVLGNYGIFVSPFFYYRISSVSYVWKYCYSHRGTIQIILCY